MFEEIYIFGIVRQIMLIISNKIKKPNTYPFGVSIVRSVNRVISQVSDQHIHIV